MNFKAGVKYNGVKIQTYYAIGIAEQIFRSHNHEMVVTSLMDGQHKEDSLHYRGLAFDCRTRDLPIADKASIFTELKAILDNIGYDIVSESAHLHIEFDPKFGENWIIYTT